MNKCYFITGTDTNVGKTVVSCALLQSFTCYGYKSVGYKPVALGSKQLIVGLRNLDAQLLRKNSNLRLNYYDINPIVFDQVTSPNIASKLTGKVIDWQIINTGLTKLKQLADIIIIEGVGGWYTPISNEQTFADWVIQQDLPVILTVGIKLGCINHAILTAQAIKQNGLLLAGWVANEIHLPNQYQDDYLLTLKEWLPAPCLGIIPNLLNWRSYSIGKFINLDKIL